MSPTTLIPFAAAALALLLVPGPAVVYIVARSAAQGRRAGLVSVLGIHVGTLVHVAAAMVGLSAILVASATAFTIVKLLGAGYLIGLGIESIRRHHHQSARVQRSPVDHRGLGRVFVDGVILNILNPKTAIFFLSFVPQFVNSGSAHPVWDVAMLGGVFIVLGLFSDSAYAMAGGWISTRLRSSTGRGHRADLVAGGTYVGLGVLAAAGAVSTD